MARTICTSPPTIYVAPGGNDSNPGTPASPQLTVQAAAHNLFNNFDCQGLPATIDVSVGQTGESVIDGSPVGLDQVIINFSVPGLYWTSTTGRCLTIAEKTIIILEGNGLTWVSDLNGIGNLPAISLHNDPTFDVLNGQNICSGQAPGDMFIQSDGKAIVTVANGVMLEGEYGPVFQALRSADWTISGPINFNGTNVGRLYDFRNCSTLNLGASYGPLGGSICGGSIASGNAVIDTNGTAGSIPGGITASSGAQIL